MAGTGRLCSKGLPTARSSLQGSRHRVHIVLLSEPTTIRSKENTLEVISLNRPQYSSELWTKEAEFEVENCFQVQPFKISALVLLLKLAESERESPLPPTLTKYLVIFNKLNKAL